MNRPKQSQNQVPAGKLHYGWVGALVGPLTISTFLVLSLFAFGQTLGPTLAGLAAESTGTFTGSYLASALLTAIAMVGAWFLPMPR